MLDLMDVYLRLTTTPEIDLDALAELARMFEAEDRPAMAEECSRRVLHYDASLSPEKEQLCSIPV
jgi:hypothetical protein